MADTQHTTTTGRRARARTRRTPVASRLAVAIAVALAVAGGLPAPSLTSPAGATPATDGNPDLAPSCGLDVTLVIDDSASINTTEAGLMRDAAQVFADALVGTPSRLKTVVFSTRATGITAAGTGSSNLADVVFRDPADYSAPTSGAGAGGTNWDDGLEVARRSTEGAGDLLVFITDGDPTYRNSVTPDGHLNDGSHALGGDGSTIGNATNLAHAVTEADALKAGGTHLFGIGIGLGGSASTDRLSAVTGDEEMTITAGVPTPPFGEADFITTPSFNDLESIVAAFTRELCGDSLNVTKQLQRANGTTEQATNADQWTFTNTLDPAPASWQNPPGTVGATAVATTDASGGVSFVWDGGANPTSHVADLSETAKAGWVYNGARCTVNSFDGTPPTVILDTVGPNQAGAAGNPDDLLDLAVPANKAVNCDVYNREIADATITVRKQTLPAATAGDFDFSLDAGLGTIDTVLDLSDGESGSFLPVAPGTYTVTEAAAPGFDLQSATCDDLGTPAVETVSAASFAVAEGANWLCTFVNAAQPGSITVVKDSGGQDGTFSFTSNTPLGNFDLTTAGGTASTAKTATPVGTYAISEVVPAGWTLANASCTGGQSPASVYVGPATDVTCTFTNTPPPTTTTSTTTSTSTSTTTSTTQPTTTSTSTTTSTTQPTTTSTSTTTSTTEPTTTSTSTTTSTTEPTTTSTSTSTSTTLPQSSTSSTSTTQPTGSTSSTSTTEATSSTSTTEPTSVIPSSTTTDGTGVGPGDVDQGGGNVGGNGLARTGSDLGGLAATGFVLLLLGGSLIRRQRLVARR